LLKSLLNGDQRAVNQNTLRDPHITPIILPILSQGDISL
jgi:hypothetical protein